MMQTKQEKSSNYSSDPDLAEWYVLPLGEVP
jgi:hypothetical protein